MIYWFTLLFWSICLEGLGRKYLPAIPSIAFYVLKDVVLLFGYLRYPPSPIVRRTAKALFGGFQYVWLATFGWTLVELFNPEQTSIELGLLGMRAYWIWWMAPTVIASVLQASNVKRQAIYVILVTAIGISVFAAIQFASPSTSDVNLYSVVNGEEIHADMAMVVETGRPRVASTFSFISGFSDFVILIPALLLSVGMGTEDKAQRKYALGATLAAAAVVPMSGSRSTVLLGLAFLALTAWTAGLFFTRVGRRVMIGSVVAMVVGVTAFPDAFIGVQSRFENREETTGRFMAILEVIPIVAIINNEFPVAGIGTGMQQNARAPMGIETPYATEGETGRYLIELGLLGYLLAWTVKVGLCVALMRSYRILLKAGRRATAGTALSYAFVTMIGNLTFDHIFQALYFVGCGFILSEVVSVLRQSPRLPVEAPPLRPPVASPR